MKSVFATLFGSALCVGGLWAAPAPIYINDIPVNASGTNIPIIDARAWVNQSVFNVVNDAASSMPLPYRSQHTFCFTNLVGATMFSVPGFHFVLDRKGSYSPMDTWVNDGTISADWIGGSLLSSSLGSSETSTLYVQATNIYNTGPLSVGTKGTLRLEGGNVKARRSGLRSGPPAPSAFFSSYTIGGRVYYNDYGISDLYWGLGDGNVLQGGGNINIDGPQNARDPYFQMPCPQSPSHQALKAPWMPSQFGFCGSTTNEVSLPDFSLNSFFCSSFGGSNQYASLTYTYRPTPTNTIVQVVFYPTNTPDARFSNSVAFETWTSDGRARVFVGFHNTEFDIVWRSNVTYSVYLVDNLMVAQSNVNYAANGGFEGLHRPNSYSLFRGGPDSLGSFFGPQGDPVFDPTLIYNPNYTAKAVPMFYTAYGAQVDGYIAPSPAFRLECATNSFLDSTNFLGRVDVLGNSVNLNRTRIRAESAVVVKSRDLVNNQLAEVNAPFVNFDVTSLKPDLTISNLAPATVRRINGKIECWSGIWDNTFTNAFTTNNYRFHVLFVDHNLRGDMPVITEQFSAKAGSLAISDPLQIGKYFRADATNLTITAGGGVTLPVGSSVDAATLVNVLNFTNHGFLSVPRAAHFGDDRLDADGQPLPYLNFVNSGTIGSGTLFVKSDRLFNSGLLSAVGGKLSIDTRRTRLLGGPTVVITNVATNYCLSGFCYPFPIFGAETNVVTTLITNTSAAWISGNSIVEINAHNLLASNSLIQAGKLILAITNDLAAGDLAAPNQWITAGGIEMRRRPTNSSSLMGVTLLSGAWLPYQQVNHVWPAKDLGPTRAGFNNNLALGHLILDGAENAIFRFFGTRANKALYVDYLELVNGATNFFGGDNALRIDPSITLYIANANVAPEKLTNSFKGRLQWVGDFAGPLSSTNIVNLCTNADSSVTSCSYVMNVALANSKDIDSDNDGLVNAEDPDPLGRCPCAQPAGLVAARGSYAGASQISLFMGRALSTELPTYVKKVGRLAIVPERREARSQVVLSWESMAGASNVVEFTTALSLTNWQVLTNFPTGPIARRLTASDELSSSGQRFYRVRVLPPWL